MEKFCLTEPILPPLRDSEKQKFWGNRMTYVAQSAAASFNPAHRLIDQTTASAIRFKIKNESDAKKDAKKLYEALNLPNPESIGDRYPHQVSGGQLQRGHDCDGYVTKTRPNSF